MGNPSAIPELTDADTARFWAHVERSDAASCWEWTSWCDKDGYGKFKLRGAVFKASRVSWTIAYGAVPGGLVIDHGCTNRRCVNPAHLDATTQEVNAWRQQGRRWAVEAQDIWRTVLTLPKDVPVSQVREVLGLGKEAVNRLIVKGTLPCHPPTGRRRYIPRDAIIDFIINRAAEDAGAPMLRALITERTAA